MFRVLACLAVSMTGGTLVLSWLEPAPSHAAPNVPLQQYLVQAKAVVNCSEAPARPWRGITIVPLRKTADRATLTAVGPQHDVHFVVDSAGTVVAHRWWRRQLPIGESQHIHIGLWTSSAAGQLARAQYLGLRTLLDELNSTVLRADMPAPLPIDLDERACGLSLARAIRTLLDAQTGRS